jgi:hypothetical protein
MADPTAESRERVVTEQARCQRILTQLEAAGDIEGYFYTSLAAALRRSGDALAFGDQEELEEVKQELESFAWNP